MRNLNKEEIKYLTEKDAISMTRFPIVKMKADEGNYIFDKSNSENWDCKIINSVQSAINTVRDHININERSISLLFTGPSQRPLSIATLPLEKGSYYPFTLKDALRIYLLTGGNSVFIMVNDPDINTKNKKYRSTAEEEALFKNIVWFFSPKIFICTNLAKDPSTEKRYMDAEYLVPFSNFFEKRGLKKNINNSISEYTEKERGINIEKIPDFSENGLLKDTYESHIDKWYFTVSIDQIKPIYYEEWKNPEIIFTTEELMDPRSKDLTPDMYRSENYSTSPIKGEEYVPIDVSFDIDKYGKELKFASDDIKRPDIDPEKAFMEDKLNKDRAKTDIE